MAKIKMKYWRKAVTNDENSKELRKVKAANKDELAKEFQAYCGEEAFMNGFDQAKEMIIQFLTQKSLGYNDAYFFRMEDLKALGEPDYQPDEPLKESERIAKWDWSKNG